MSPSLLPNLPFSTSRHRFSGHLCNFKFRLAAQVDDFKALLGKPSPDDESAEEFDVRLRQWRREGTGSDSRA